MLLHRFPILRGLRISDLLFSLKKEKKSRENVRRFLPTTKSSRHNVFSKAFYYLVSVTIRNKQSNEKYNGYIYFLCFRMKNLQK